MMNKIILLIFVIFAESTKSPKHQRDKHPQAKVYHEKPPKNLTNFKECMDSMFKNLCKDKTNEQCFQELCKNDAKNGEPTCCTEYPIKEHMSALSKFLIFMMCVTIFGLLFYVINMWWPIPIPIFLRNAWNTILNSLPFRNRGRHLFNSELTGGNLQRFGIQNLDFSDDEEPIEV
ncbi:hypothetical protein RF11_11773 [Thelohanellus kitauei]|uniref:Uncharacterized protein n=1 Tax=Thelohanellus kitauei TaxID=669202 RepID=A0A0C2IV29_THEKT|nr:hypothetical protein RF11_11773 [Thelohanellus kitauei]